MRRLAHRVFTALSALSLLLCVAVCVLWVRSYGLEDQDHLAWRGCPTWMAQTKHGRLWLSRWELADPVPTLPMGIDLVWTLRGTTNPPYQPDTPIRVGRMPPPLMASNGFGFWSFAGDLGTTSNGQVLGRYALLGIPFWFLAACFLMLPTAWLGSAWRRRRRRRVGLCPQCGYDLRASLGRCPECGTSAAPMKQGAAP